MFCTTQWMQRHTTPHLENKNKRNFSGGSGCWEAEACAPPGVLLIYLWGLYSMSRLIFVADLIACRHILSCAVAFRPVTPIRGCGVSSLCGCSRWCLLLLAGWCEEIYSVRVSEAIAAYVVLVPFLLVE